MDIFESLENLNVSEECFEDIISIVEELLSEDIPEILDKREEKRLTKERVAQNVLKSTKSPERTKKAENAIKNVKQQREQDEERGEQHWRDHLNQIEQKEKEGIKKGSMEVVIPDHGYSYKDKTQQAEKFYPKNMRRGSVYDNLINYGDASYTKEQVGDAKTKQRREEAVMKMSPEKFAKYYGDSEHTKLKTAEEGAKERLEKRRNRGK